MTSEASDATAVPIGVVTVSDRASRGIYQDLSGPAIETYLTEVLATPFRIVRRIVEDEQPAIEAALKELCDVEGCHLVVTTGGTGPAPRDVTPEALFAVCDRMMPGFGEAMRAKSLTIVPTAILSRQEAGLRGCSLIINLPGKPASIRDCLDGVRPGAPSPTPPPGGHRLDPRPERMVAFRPKGA